MMHTREIQAIFFDMGGVLMDVSPGYSREEAFRRSLGGPAMRAYLGDDFDLQRFLAFFETVLSGRAQRDPGIQEDAWREDKVMMERYTGRLVPYDALREKFWTHIAYMTRCFEPISGVRDVLKDLTERGYIIGLISNVFHPAIVYKELFTQWEIIDFFEPLLFSSEFRYKKPNPAIFRYALSWYPQILPEQVMYVGDTWEIDVEGARGVGMVPVWVNREGAMVSRDGVPVVRHIRELVDVLSARDRFTELTLR
ncbi:HAD family hydrolase [bacterium]|nr:HAD family hydrolase [candidate division CSSED10-310 bacterium]